MHRLRQPLRPDLTTDEAKVKSIRPNQTFGTEDTLRVRGGNMTILYKSYLKFDLNDLSGTLVSAKLRLYVTEASRDGHTFYSADRGLRR